MYVEVALGGASRHDPHTSHMRIRSDAQHTLGLTPKRRAVKNPIDFRKEMKIQRPSKMTSPGLEHPIPIPHPPSPPHLNASTAVLQLLWLEGMRPRFTRWATPCRPPITCHVALRQRHFPNTLYHVRSRKTVRDNTEGASDVIVSREKLCLPLFSVHRPLDTSPGYRPPAPCIGGRRG